MDERSAKAFDFAADVSKQLITLATGIIAFTVTFNKDLLNTTPSSVNHTSVKFIVGAWGLYLLSIFCGLVSLFGLTGELQPHSKKLDDDADGMDTSPNLSNPFVKWGTICQLALFGFATLVVLAFGIYAIS
ncbi:MAG: hypothetical protein JNL64_11155 [Blastocatellia bacterium]|nr:hypothetical protein [Blastocatellia bacterium]